jgi:hypothetical protein
MAKFVARTCSLAFSWDAIVFRLLPHWATDLSAPDREYLMPRDHRDDSLSSEIKQANFGVACCSYWGAPFSYLCLMCDIQFDTRTGFKSATPMTALN